MTILAAIDATRRAVESDAARAVMRVRAEAQLGVGAEVAVRSGTHAFTVDEPVSMGGGGAGPNPVQLVLAALASCQAITYRYWSEQLGIRIEGLTVRVEGDVDVRGFLGLAAGVPAGATSVRCVVTIDGPEPERYEELAEAVDAHCPVLDVFTSTVPVERRLEQGAS